MPFKTDIQRRAFWAKNKGKVIKPSKNTSPYDKEEQKGRVEYPKKRKKLYKTSKNGKAKYMGETKARELEASGHQIVEVSE